jgi:thymidine kinase
MFAGKTEELQRLARRAVQGGRKALRLIPSHDTRSDGAHLSHAGRKEPAIPVWIENFDFLTQVRDHRGDIVFLDEGQLFGPKLVRHVHQLVRLGTDVVVACLNRDYRGQPYETTERLLGVADTFVSLTAVCVSCCQDATHTHRTGDSTDREFLGGLESYEPRCRTCWLQVVRDPWTPD